MGVPIVRIIVFWGLSRGPPYFGKLPKILGPNLGTGTRLWDLEGSKRVQ